MTNRSLLALLLPLALAGCLPARRPAPLPPPPAPTRADLWRRIATPVDADRLARLGQAWDLVRADIHSPGTSAALASERRLLDPAAGLARPAPTPGSYACRLVRVETRPGAALSIQRFKPTFCYVEVEGDLLTFVKQGGRERPSGRLWDDDVRTRLVYLGTLAMGDREAARTYGENPDRDVAGVLERIAPFVWRLVIPWPKGNARLDVYELTPVERQP